MQWKTLGGRCLYHQQGIRVFDNFIFRWLKFDSEALQSLINTFKPQSPQLYYINALILMAKNRPGDTCLLGLGGGGALHALPSSINRTLAAVEASKELIDVAKQFFRVTDIPHLQIIHDEASHFVSHCSSSFQHLIIDLFDAKHFPSSCANSSFFAHCSRLLRAGGHLAINLANQEEQPHLFQMIRQEFNQDTVVIPVKKCQNLIILVQKGGRIVDTLRAHHSHTLKRLSWDAHWGIMAEIK